jgi:hypothetical protein
MSANTNENMREMVDRLHRADSRRVFATLVCVCSVISIVPRRRSTTLSGRRWNNGSQGIDALEQDLLRLALRYGRRPFRRVLDSRYGAVSGFLAPDL